MVKRQGRKGQTMIYRRLEIEQSKLWCSGRV